MLAFRRLATRRRVIVNLKTEKAFRGILFRKAGPLLELRDVELLELNRPPMKLDGAVIIERGNVDFVQVVDA